MIPQIYLFLKKKNIINDLTAHYIAAQGFSKIINLIFWCNTFH